MPHPMLVLLLLGAAVGVYGKDSNGYFNGRATYYKDNTQGSCRFGAPSDQFYAAWPDGQEGAPQCGSCFEVRCVNKNFRDGYGQMTQRSSACFDESRTVVVKIIDSCPCVHENFYSNQRWCCGDQEHIDLGEEAFKMLADQHWGVIGVRFKQTSCDNLGSSNKGSGDDNKGSSPSDQQGANNSGDSEQPGLTGDSITASIKKASNNFDKKWQDLSSKSDTKWKAQKPDWFKSMFNDDDWRR